MKIGKAKYLSFTALSLMAFAASQVGHAVTQRTSSSSQFVTLPLAVWVLTRYFQSIPVELEEAAIIDGASRLDCLIRITLALSLSGLMSVLVYSFVTTCNEFIFALCFAIDASVKTLPIGLAEFSTEFNTDWGAVMAASAVMTLPVTVLFLSMQKLFVGGLTAGATKG